MSGSTHVFIVCSPRPRVGKTLVARLIAEFYRVSERPVAGFDLEPFEPAFVEFLPGLVQRISLNDTRGQMALFDRLVMDDDTAKVIDLGHLALEKFFTVASQIGLGHEVRRRGISAMVAYVADQANATLNTYSVLRARFPELGFVPVYNDGIARGIELRRHFPASAGGVAPLGIPQLSPSLRSYVDSRPFSFVDRRRMLPTDGMREELDGFTKRVFRQLREMELTLLMSNLKSSLIGGDHA